MSRRKEDRMRGIRLFRLAARLPLPLLHALGAAVGLLFARIPNLHLRTTRVNLALCLPELPRSNRDRLARRSLVETGKTVAESIALWLAPGRRVLRLVREVRGQAAVEEALAAGRGVIFAGPHLGAWELAGLYASSRWPLTALYRPPRNKAIGGIIHQARERLGARLVPTDAKGVRQLLQALRRGEAAGILPDQDPHEPDGLFAPFFGIPANTISLLSRLAARTGAPVFIAYAERLAFGRGYRIHFVPAEPAVHDPDPAVATAALNRAVEASVRRIPEQYQWSYRRFYTRPPGELRLYRRDGRADARHPLAARLPRELVRHGRQ